MEMEAMCTGCLSTGRKLNFIGETGYYHVYTQILNEIPVYDLSQVCIRICWECRARLRSMQTFKRQVQQNYADLMQHIPPQGKSSLSAHSQFIFSYPDQSVDLKTEPYEEVKCEQDCDTEFAHPLNVPNDIREGIREPIEKKSPKGKRKKSNKIKAKKKREKTIVIEPAGNGLDDSHIDDSLMEESHIDDIHTEESHIDDSHMKESHIDESHIQESHIGEDNGKGSHNGESNLKENVKIGDTTISVLPKGKKLTTKEKKVVVKRKRDSQPLPERPQCQECGKVFSSKKTYRYHLNVLHKGQNQYPCPRCGKVYQWKSNLGRHMRSHKAVDDGELFCALCDKSFASVATYRQHLRISRRHVPETDFSFACESCGKRFVSKTRLRDHIDWEHLHKIKFRCQMCDKPFKCHTSLYVHVQNVHATHKRRENLCHVCGKSYQNAAKLKYHITAMHSGDTPYRCGECGACFGWYSSLYRHTREVHYKMKGLNKKAKKAKQGRTSPVPLNPHYPPPLAPI